MVKEKIFNYLKTKMDKTSLSERTLQSIAQSYESFFADENALTDESLEKILANAKSVEGQYSHDLSEGLSAVKKTEQTATQPVKAVESSTTVVAEPSELEKALKEKMSQIDKFLEEQKSKEEAIARQHNKEELTRNVKEALLSKGCEDGVFLKLALTQLDVEKDLESNVNSLKEAYDKEYSDAMLQGVVVPRLGGTVGNAMSDDEREARVKSSIQALKNKHLIG